MRYEVRIYHLEEFNPENRMTYCPCQGRGEAMEKYAEYLDTYNDPNHEVELCEVNYTMYGERVRVCASTRNGNPRHIVWEEDWLDEPEPEGDCEEDCCFDCSDDDEPDYPEGY